MNKHKLIIRIVISMAAIFSFTAAMAVPPVASNVTIPAGPFIPGNTVIGSYTYFDAEGDPESGTTIQWYVNSTPSPTGATLVSSGSTSYLISAAYRGQYLSMAVTPDNLVDPPGTKVYSNWERINSLPQGTTDNYINLSSEGADLVVVAPGVLGNDSDNEQPTQTIQAIPLTSPDYGDLTLNTNGSFTYSHDGSENHTDDFTYRVFDGYEYSTPVTVNIQVIPVNDAPVFTSDSITTATEDVSYVYNITTSDAENNTRSITYVGTLPTWLGLTDYGNGTARLSGTPDNDDVGTHDVHLRVSDVSESSDQEFQIEVSNVNDAPVLSNIEATMLAYQEGDPATIITSTIQVTDPDNDSLVSATITIITGLVSGEDQLSFTATPPLSTSYSPVTGQLSITGKAPVSRYQTALRNVRYRNTNNINPNDGNRVVRFVVNDGSLPSNTLTRTIDFTAVNDAPQANDDNYYNVLEGGSLTTSAATGVLNNDEDLDGPSAITAYLVDDVISGYLSFNPDGSFVYEHDSSDVLSDMFTYYAWDGMDRSDTVEVNISMLPVNDPPVLANYPEDTLVFTEDDDPRIILPNVQVNDEDDTEIESATVVIDQGYVMGEDSLVFAAVSGLTIEFDTLTGILTATGTASLATYQNSLLRNLRYWNTNTEDPNTQYRRISFTINDGEDDSDPALRVIEIVPWNDPPEAENATLIGTNFYVGELLTADYDFTDPDGDAEGNTTVRWWTAEDDQGTNRNQITGWLTDTFTTRFSEGGLYLSAVVRPFDEHGLSGIRDTTQWEYIDAAPEFIGFSIRNFVNPNVFAPNETVKADFTYEDLEGDEAGEHEFQWYRSDGTWASAQLLNGEDADSFLIGESEKNKWIAVRGTPHALDGSTPGRLYESPWYLVSELPSATISLAPEAEDSICDDGFSTTTLVVNLTGSNPPWSFTYTIDGADPTTIEGIAEEDVPYEFEVSQAGTYALTEVSDDKVPMGLVSGEVIVGYYFNPWAVMPESDITICDNPVANYEIPVELYGKAPWRLSYQFDGDTDSTYVTGIDTAYYGIDVTASDIGNYALLHVWDANCMSTLIGSADVAIKDSPMAFMDGDTAICPNDTAILNVELSGAGPWTFTYARNGTDETDVYVNQSVSSYTYPLEVTNPGLYAIVGVEDTEDVGCASGTIDVQHYNIPTATIGGTARACEGSSTEFTVTLTGIAPWTITYQHNTEPEETIANIQSSPLMLSADEAGNYRIPTVEDAHCAGPGSGVANLVVDPLPDVSILGMQSKYSITTDEVLMNVEPEGGDFELSSFPDAIWPREGEWYFIPFYAYLNYGSPFWIRYSYEDPATGCVGTAEHRVFIIQNAAEIQIDNEKGMYCFNDDTLKIFGLNIRDNDGTFTITNNEGLLEMEADSALIFPWVIEEGQKTVTYTVEIDGEIETAQKNLDFNKIYGDFTWDQECLSNDAETFVNFTDISTSTLGDLGWSWNIYFPEDTVTAGTNTARVQFNDLEQHKVECIVTATRNDDVCYDTVSKPFSLKPTFKIGELTYDEKFAVDTAYWTSASINGGQNSWTFGKPSGGPWTSVPASEKAWYTDIINHQATENSYVISPCFDFTQALEFNKPLMVKLSLWRGFALPVDGAVLQYTTDNGLEWTTIGDFDDGIEWYNSSNIQGEPGGQIVGWTSNTSDPGWITAKHKLDIPGLMSSSNVRFRIAYGATGIESDNHGIAIDNIWIGERKKKVLYEHFTNTDDEFCGFIENQVNALVNAAENNRDIIDIQYHLGEPEFGPDPFYDLNPEYADSRKFYYNVQDVPYGVVDGGRSSQTWQIKYTDDEELTQNMLTKAALEDNSFELVLHATPKENYFDLGVTITALKSIPQKEMKLHVVIIENQITDETGGNGKTHFESVFKSMLPDAFGTSINRSWSVNDEEYFDFRYDYLNVYNDTSLRAVVFIQDVASKEVYQAGIVDPHIVTDLDPGHKGNDLFILFPNPAEAYTYVKLSELPDSRLLVEILDLDGRLVYQEEVYPQSGLCMLSLEGLKDGVYSVRIRSAREVLGTKRLIKLDTQ